MLRQLKQAPDGLVIEVSFVNTKTTTACVLSEARDNPSQLLSSDPKRLPRAFRLALSRPMGTKRGRGERSFVRETRQQAIDFYRELVQDLRPWQARAPRLPQEPERIEERPQPDPPPFTADAEREAGTAAPPPGESGPEHAGTAP
jgi:hypothetical protein